ncbi:DUF3267 domain-containing protein [Lysinibacillus sp. fkY74-1]|uniref:DUF3267 domain-containing protein n=4 Tax=Lysinibacillus TaxID=400634 RepID=B1HPL2_LYSSC|nr:MULTISPECIES: DUF3267 domain-containing protein [Lysinibacillus]MBE5085980.1 DUF3267 domain-containing protein [Bacillus thuringiensis]MBI6864767.1 DUF3267 domain-containing protein [Lysinibacillus fusiformis]ACA42214.1 conserved hypothetical protein [Lysinibacillus sphaericus C3-41]EWH31623.1 hypothetical protein P799_19190 [Lysinibacillus sphaericus CBAM5]MCS1398717.1 DUF3267 domain-containing protein [Lysinibacillus sp. PB211]
MLPNKEPIVIELDIKKLMIDNIVITSGLVILFTAIQYICFKDFHFSFWPIVGGTVLFVILYIIFIMLHEAFHLIGFMLFGKVPLESLKYGINLELGVAYATTTKPLYNHAMKRALLLPFWMTGVLPTIAGFYFNSTILILVGAFLMAGAVGDFAMYKELQKYPNNALVQDDPELPKLYVYTEKDRSPR